MNEAFYVYKQQRGNQVVMNEAAVHPQSHLSTLDWQGLGYWSHVSQDDAEVRIRFAEYDQAVKGEVKLNLYYVLYSNSFLNP